MRPITLTILALASTAIAQHSRPTSRPASSPTWDPAWQLDYDAAVASARAAKRDLLVHFCASDWSLECGELRKRVFDRAEFTRPASRAFELCVLDFPQGAAAQSNVPDLARNREVAIELGIAKFPTLLLISPADDVLARLESAPNDPTECLAILVAKRDEGRARFETIHRLEAALIDTEDATDTIRAAVRFLASSEPGAAGNARLAAIARAALALDPTVRAELRIDALRALFASRESLPPDRQHALDIDPKNERGLLEHAVEAEVSAVRSRADSYAALDSIDHLIGLPIVDRERGRTLFANAARWADAARDPQIRDRAPRFAAAAIELGIPNTELAKFLHRIAMRTTK